MHKQIVAALFAGVALAALHGNSMVQDRDGSPCTYTDIFGQEVHLKSCEAAIGEGDLRGMITGFTLANLCAITGELQLAGLKPREAARCHRTGKLDPRTTHEVAMNVQNLLKVEVDGWLKSSDFIELVCLGVSKQLPHADRYAGYMFATGFGLPKNLPAALALLRRGKSRLVGQMDKLSDKGDLAFYQALAARTQTIIDEIGDDSGPTPGPRELDDLCTGSVREMKRRSKENLEKIGGWKIASTARD